MNSTKCVEAFDSAQVSPSIHVAPDVSGLSMTAAASCEKLSGREKERDGERPSGHGRGRTMEQDEAKVDRALEDVRRRVCDLWRSARIAILRGKMTLLRDTGSCGYLLQGTSINMLNISTKSVGTQVQVVRFAYASKM